MYIVVQSGEREGERERGIERESGSGAYYT
jgi:hypothetical protein